MAISTKQHYHPKSPATRRGNAITETLFLALLSLPLALLAGLCLFLLSAAVLMLLPDPFPYLRPVAYLALLCAALLGGLLLSRLPHTCKTPPAACLLGILLSAGLILCRAVLPACLQLTGSADRSPLLCILLPITVLAGAMLPKRKKTAGRRHRR